MNKFKIPEATLNRKSHMQTMNVELQSKVACPRCKSDAGYYCETAKGDKSPFYHQARFDKYIRTATKQKA